MQQKQTINKSNAMVKKPKPDNYYSS